MNRPDLLPYRVFKMRGGSWHVLTTGGLRNRRALCSVTATPDVEFVPEPSAASWNARLCPTCARLLGMLWADLADFAQACGVDGPYRMPVPATQPDDVSPTCRTALPEEPPDWADGEPYWVRHEADYWRLKTRGA